LVLINHFEKSNNKPAAIESFFASLILATSIAACGGSGATVENSIVGGTNTLPTLDLKTVDGAQNASAIAGGFLTITSFTSDTAGQRFSSESGNFEIPCSGGGKFVSSLLNPDGKPTIGDSFKFDQVACVTEDSAGISTASSSNTQTLDYG
jgi:hypothetical protein